MRTGAVSAYANSRVPDQPANLKMDFGIYMQMDMFYINQGFCKWTAKSLIRLRLHGLIQAVTLFV